jgi:hypothetical protein
LTSSNDGHYKHNSKHNDSVTFFDEHPPLNLQWSHMWHKAMRNRGKDMGDGLLHGCELGRQSVGDTPGASPANQEGSIQCSYVFLAPDQS